MPRAVSAGQRPFLVWSGASCWELENPRRCAAAPLL